MLMALTDTELRRIRELDIRAAYALTGDVGGIASKHILMANELLNLRSNTYTHYTVGVDPSRGEGYVTVRMFGVRSDGTRVPLDHKTVPLPRVAEDKVDEPPPITCCGEWTWDGQGWRRWDRVRFCYTPNSKSVLVCAKCHRSALPHGKLTGPLVDSDKIFNVPALAHAALLPSVVIAGLEIATWGTSNE
jgi:hypothetical protein